MVSWHKQWEYNAQGYQKSELCGFKWANTHSKCFFFLAQTHNIFVSARPDGPDQ